MGMNGVKEKVVKHLHIFLYIEITTIYCERRTEHLNTRPSQNTSFWKLKVVMSILTVMNMM